MIESDKDKVMMSLVENMNRVVTDFYGSPERNIPGVINQIKENEERDHKDREMILDKINGLEERFDRVLENMKSITDWISNVRATPKKIAKFIGIFVGGVSTLAGVITLVINLVQMVFE